MQKEQVSDFKVVHCLTPATRTADANGTAVDTQGYGSVSFFALFGASGDTLSGSVYAEVELEESDDNSTFTDVADADVVTAVTGTNTGTIAVVNDPAEDDQTYKAGYIGGKRYVRPVYNVTGTHSNGMPVAVIAVLSNPTYAPAA